MRKPMLLMPMRELVGPADKQFIRSGYQIRRVARWMLLPITVLGALAVFFACEGHWLSAAISVVPGSTVFWIYVNTLRYAQAVIREGRG